MGEEREAVSGVVFSSYPYRGSDSRSPSWCRIVDVDFCLRPPLATKFSDAVKMFAVFDF